MFLITTGTVVVRVENVQVKWLYYVHYTHCLFLLRMAAILLFCVLSIAFRPCKGLALALSGWKFNVLAFPLVTLGGSLSLLALPLPVDDVLLEGRRDEFWCDLLNSINSSFPADFVLDRLAAGEEGLATASLGVVVLGGRLAGTFGLLFLELL